MASPEASGGGGPVAYAAGCLLLMALAGLAQGLADLIDSVDSDNSQPNRMGISAMTVNMTTDFAALAEAIVTAKKNCDAARNLVSAADERTVEDDPSVGIRHAFYFVEASTLLMGFGSPYAGEDLAEGSKQLATLTGQLDSAIPGDGWQGVSAKTYVERVGEIRESLYVLADTDQWCADIAAEVAYFVNCIRLICGCLKLVLEMAYVLIRYCYSNADIEAGDMWDFQILVGVMIVMGLLILAVQLCSVNIKKWSLQPIADDYRSYCN